ncbi:hypothetical protein DH2020_022894 [Rehmannia glutinosa]|uniref:Uncharacterized protein n=1 Tax=Rehmannia glutinosa TaxID=99300 RepID=A0ABR0W7E6_REHGL
MDKEQVFNKNSNMSDGDESTRNGESDVNSDSDYNINVDSVDRSSQPKRKRSYHRHTPLQIQELEAVFKECPHPDERQRKELSRELGMEPLQVKFWFQNKRTQMKIDLISAMTSKKGKPLTSSTNIPSSSTAYLPGNFNGTYQAGDLGSSVKFAQQNELGSKPMVIELATAAMEELMRIAQLGEPLWVPSMDRNTASLNEDEYLRSFSRVFGPKPCGFKSEASRETVVVAMSAANVIEILMDVVNAEFQVASPLVPTRESYFVRYCRQDVDGTWAVVDVSLDQMHSTPLHICRRRPSGCIVRDMPNGYSKVTWVEHVEVEEGGAQSIYKPLITAGLAFGAKRWVAILDGYCERVERAIATDVPTSDLNYLDQEGRKSMLKLAERMVTRYCSGVNASTGNTWTTLPGNANDNVKVMTRRNVDDPTMPFGIQLSVATSFWLPVTPKTVFDFLRDHHNRKEWDLLSCGGEFQEVTHIVSGNQQGNRIAIYQVKGGNSSQTEMTMLQESRTDPTASYVVYAPIEMVCVNAVLGGGDPGYVPLLPSGFAILPDGPTGTQGRGMASQPDSGGSLLTIAIQVIVDSAPNAKLSLGSIGVASRLITCTVDKIKQALVPKSS